MEETDSTLAYSLLILSLSSKSSCPKSGSQGQQLRWRSFLRYKFAFFFFFSLRSFPCNPCIERERERERRERTNREEREGVIELRVRAWAVTEQLDYCSSKRESEVRRERLNGRQELCLLFLRLKAGNEPPDGFNDHLNKEREDGNELRRERERITSWSCKLYLPFNLDLLAIPPPKSSALSSEMSFCLSFPVSFSLFLFSLLSSPPLPSYFRTQGTETMNRGRLLRRSRECFARGRWKVNDTSLRSMRELCASVKTLWLDMCTWFGSLSSSCLWIAFSQSWKSSHLFLILKTNHELVSLFSSYYSSSIEIEHYYPTTQLLPLLSWQLSSSSSSPDSLSQSVTREENQFRQKEPHPSFIINRKIHTWSNSDCTGEIHSPSHSSYSCLTSKPESSSSFPAGLSLC